MFKTVLFALALTAGFFASPTAIDSKEQPPVLIEIARADVPCPVLVTATPTQVAVKVKAKKKFHSEKEQTKKKHVSGSRHHKSKVPHHHKSNSSHHHQSHGPTKIPTTLGPLHLTSPPGCA